MFVCVRYTFHTHTHTHRHPPAPQTQQANYFTNSLQQQGSVVMQMNTVLHDQVSRVHTLFYES